MNTAQKSPIQWTAGEFERLVLEDNPRVAVFDCDGTLWSGDAGSGFMYWSIEEGLVPTWTAKWMEERYRDYQDGKVNEVEICGDMVLIYSGLGEQQLRFAAEQYVNEFVQPRLFTEMTSLLSKLQQRGVELWAVSSTNKWVIAAGVRGLGFSEDRIIAAELRAKDGIITSEVMDVPTGEAKAVALARVGVTHPDAVFGNSVHDLAMLKLARRAFPVNPSPALLKAAEEHGWGYFLPQAAEDTPAAVGGE